MALRKLFGKEQDLEALPAELRGLLEDMRKERSAFEAAVVRATEAQKIAEDLATRVAKAQQQLGPLAEKLAGFEGLAGQVVALKKDFDAAATGGKEAHQQLDETRRIVTVTRTELDGLRGMLQEAMALKKDVAAILAEQGRLAALATQLRETAERATQVESQHQRVKQGSDEASSRLAAVEERCEKVSAGVAAFVERAAGFERTAEDLRQLAAELPNVKRELGALHAMSDVVTQKTAAVEGQRDAVERATKGAERLTELVGQVDRQLQEQQGNLGFLGQLQEQVGELKQLHGTLLERTEELQKHQRAIESDIRAQKETFDSTRDSMQDSLTGFAFEREGLAAMNQRVVQLRELLAAVEQRMPALETTKGALDQATAAAGQLSKRLAALADEVEQVEASAAPLRGVRDEAHGVAATARELLAKAEGLSRPAIQSLEETERRVSDVNAALEGLEHRALQLEGQRTAIAEMNRELITRQAALDTGLSQLDKATALREQAAGMVGRLEQDSASLRATLDAAAEAGARADTHLGELDERVRRFEDVRARIARFETRFAALLSADETIERALARAAERQATVDALREDLSRLFTVADDTAGQVRAVAGLQKEIDERRAGLEEVAGKLRDLERQSERIAERGQQFAEAEQRLTQLDAHLSGLQATLETVLAQKDFLDKVIETAGALSFQTMQAEGVLTQLRQQQDGMVGGKKSGRK